MQKNRTFYLAPVRRSFVYGRTDGRTDIVRVIAHFAKANALKIVRLEWAQVTAVAENKTDFGRNYVITRSDIGSEWEPNEIHRIFKRDNLIYYLVSFQFTLRLMEIVQFE